MEAEKSIIGFLKMIAGFYESGHISDTNLSVSQLYSLADVYLQDIGNEKLPPISKHLTEKVIAENGSKWISVNDRIPSDDGDNILECLVRIKDKHDEIIVLPAVFVANLKCRQGEWWDKGSLHRHRAGGEPYSGVMDWQPLPTACEAPIYIPLKNTNLTKAEAFQAIIDGQVVTHDSLSVGDMFQIVSFPNKDKPDSRKIFKKENDEFDYMSLRCFEQKRYQSAGFESGWRLMKRL